MSLIEHIVDTFFFVSHCSFQSPARRLDMYIYLFTYVYLHLQPCRLANILSTFIYMSFRYSGDDFKGPVQYFRCYATQPSRFIVESVCLIVLLDRKRCRVPVTPSLVWGVTHSPSEKQTRWLLHIHYFFDFTMKDCIVLIQMEQWSVHRCN